MLSDNALFCYGLGPLKQIGHSLVARFKDHG